MALRATQPQKDMEHGKTYDDLLAMPDDGNRYELIFGEIVVSPSPLTIHQWALSRLQRAMSDFVEERQLGLVFVAPLDVRFSRFNVVQPDILFLGLAQIRKLGEKLIEGPPDIVVEI